MSNTLHFKITLRGVTPLIWRQFQVGDDYRIDRFHQVIQIVMGWHNSHLHEFRFQDRQIGMPYDDGFDMVEIEDETTLSLKDLSLKKGDEIFYLYDFGDCWEHIIQLEKIADIVLLNPICTDGQNACPLEDSGGFGGYTDLLNAIKNPSDPEYDYLREWIPENFNPTKFSLDEINIELTKFGKWHRKHPRAKSTPWHQI